jgi:hypothetical protein
MPETATGPVALPIPHSEIRIPHWQRTLFLNSFWDGRLGQLAFEFQ